MFCRIGTVGLQWLSLGRCRLYDHLQLWNVRDAHWRCSVSEPLCKACMDPVDLPWPRNVTTVKTMK